MNRFVTLMRREWLQHRFGWALMVLIPLALAVLLTAFGQVEIDADTADGAGPHLPAMLAMSAIGGGTMLMFVILCFSSLVIVGGLARRDHADRSIEFWLSLPVSHTQSLSAPLLVHLLLAPVVALIAGLAGGYLVSAILVSRVVGIEAWFALPWGDIVTASLSFVLRVVAGLPLALLWLSPLVLLIVLLTAWFGRWGHVVLGVGIGLGSTLLKKVFGLPLVADAIVGWMANAARALVNARDGGFDLKGSDGFDALSRVPGWAVSDFGLALRDLASPLLLAGLVLAAVCFALLLQWRQRGASASS